MLEGDSPLDTPKMSIIHRFLEEAVKNESGLFGNDTDVFTNEPTLSPTMSPTMQITTPFTEDEIEECEELASSDDSKTLRTTMQLYGGMFLIILTVFCFLRQRYPQVYKLRSWVDDIKTDIATDSRGMISWMWKVFFLTDAEMMDQCGMDALCYCRVLEMGLKLSAVGILNALWLIPVYGSARDSRLTDCIEDWVLKINVSHVPSESYRLCATVVAAYAIFGFSMYTVLEEFQWFIMFRHRFLSKKLSRNYSVYVQCIPPELRSNDKLLQFFQQASSQGAVLDAHLAVKIPTLQAKVAERQALVAQIEHAINKEELRGVTLTRRNPLAIGAPAVGLIDSLFEELRELNKYISEAIDTIERQAAGLPSIQEEDTKDDMVEFTPSLQYPNLLMGSGVEVPTADDRETTSRVSALSVGETAELEEGAPPPYVQTNDKDMTNKSKDSGSGTNTASKLLTSLASQVPTQGLVDLANQAKSLLQQEEGVPHSAGFVTFRSLRSTQAALQMVQYPEPFAMEVLEAPQPEDINWGNVGKTHEELQAGKLLSFGLTATLCLFWTIPIAFINSLSSIEGISEELPGLEDILEKHPNLAQLFIQVAPVLLIIADEVLTMLLESLSGLEGPISGAVVQSKLFSKLSAFMLIQKFFVSNISSGIMEQLTAMVKEPEKIVDLLAQSLPSQSTFFIQVLMVDAFLSMGIELLRVSAVVTAALRSHFGPRLTEKERSTTWMGLRPLNDPLEFEHANRLAGTVFYFMVFFVYSTLAPLSSFFMFICFLVMAGGYRHQFIYIYPTFPDSGGKLWTAFIRLCPICMIIAEVTIVGLLALKKAPVASAMMFPLLVITILFNIYIQQQHFKISEFLPSKDAIAIDLKNAAERIDYDFLKDQYVQPELQERELLPENATVEREIRHGNVSFVTPPNSVHEDENAEIGAEQEIKL